MLPASSVLQNHIVTVVRCCRLDFAKSHCGATPLPFLRLRIAKRCFSDLNFAKSFCILWFCTSHCSSVKSLHLWNIDTRSSVSPAPLFCEYLNFVITKFHRGFLCPDRTPNTSYINPPPSCFKNLYQSIINPSSKEYEPNIKKQRFGYSQSYPDWNSVMISVIWSWQTKFSNPLKILSAVPHVNWRWSTNACQEEMTIGRQCWNQKTKWENNKSKRMIMRDTTFPVLS